MKNSQALSYTQMDILCRELQERVIGFKVANCLPNNRQRFFLVLRHQQHQEALFFCFSPPGIRFHLTYSQPLPSADSSHPLWHFLKDAFLKEVCLLQQDRILQLTFETPSGKKLLIAEFFSKHPNYYLLDANQAILFALHPLNTTHYHLPPVHTSPLDLDPCWSSHREVEQAYLELEQIEEAVKKKKKLESELAKQIKKLQKKEQDLLQALEQCHQWSKVHHEGELIKANLASIKKGNAVISVWDWMSDQSYDLNLDPMKTPQEEMKIRFRRAKKLQAGSIPLQQQLEKIRSKLHQVQQQQQQLTLLTTQEELDSFKIEVFPSSSIQKVSLSSLPHAKVYREYCSAKGLKIWVGKNAKANDQLTFRIANGRDWWLHVKGWSGSHVIIRMAKDQQPDPETIEDAMQLALYYSKARDQGEGEVCLTQRKYVTQMHRKQAGQVQISKHRTVWVRFDPHRYRALKERLALP